VKKLVVEATLESSASEQKTPPSKEALKVTSIGGIFHVNMNCENFERSRAFYERVGFQMILEFPEGEYPDVGRGLGVGRHRVKGALMMIGSDPSATFLDLLEWIEPKHEPRSRPALTETGVHRLALRTTAFEDEVERLRQAGMSFVNEPITVVGPTGQSGRFVCFPDPDGNMLELLEVGPQ